MGRQGLQALLDAQDSGDGMQAILPWGIALAVLTAAMFIASSFRPAAQRIRTDCLDSCGSRRRSTLLCSDCRS